jgi:drug/metabolite transporter (DMT)-like permease
MICTVFGFAFQPLAQKYISVERTGQIAAVNPMAAAFLGWLVLGETMGIVKIVGAALIILGLLVSENRKKEKLLMKSA